MTVAVGFIPRIRVPKITGVAARRLKSRVVPVPAQHTPWSLIYSVSVLFGMFIFGLIASMAMAVFNVTLNKLKGVVGEHVLEITEGGLTESTEFNRTTITWEGITGLKETGSFFFLFIADQFAHPIPKKKPLGEADLKSLIGECGLAILDAQAKKGLVACVFWLADQLLDLKGILPAWVSKPVLVAVASVLGMCGVLVWRVHEGRSRVTVRKIVMPPLGMATGFCMFLVPMFRVPLTWALTAFVIGAVLLSYPLLLTSSLQREGEEIMMKRSSAFFAVIVILAAIRYFARECFDRFLTLEQTGGLFFVLAFGMILRWRLRLLSLFLKLARTVPSTERADHP